MTHIEIVIIQFLLYAFGIGTIGGATLWIELRLIKEIRKDFGGK